MTNLFIQIPIGEKLGDFFAYGGPGKPGLGILVTSVVDVILVFSLFVALIFLIVGALNWITSEGKPDKLEKARNQIIQAVTGLAIAFAAWAIWILIVKRFLGLDIEGGINLGINQ